MSTKQEVAEIIAMTANCLRMENTEKESQDCIQELTEKLADERKINSVQNEHIARLEQASSDNLATIMALQTHIDTLSEGE